MSDLNFEALEFLYSVSNRALHLTWSTFIISLRYITVASVVTNIGPELFSKILPHSDVWCLFLQLLHVLLRYYAALCLGPVHLKQSFLSLRISWCFMVFLDLQSVNL